MVVLVSHTWLYNNSNRHERRSPSARTKEFDVNTPTPAAAAPPAERGAAVVLPDDDATRLSGRRAALLIATLLLGVLSFQLNASMVTPALPQIAADFGESADSAAPVQSMFFLAGAIAGPVIGR